MGKLPLWIAIQYCTFRHWLAVQTGNQQHVRYFHAKLGQYLFAQLGHMIDAEVRRNAGRPKPPFVPPPLSNEPEAGDIVCPGPNGIEIWTPDLKRMKRLL